MRYVLIVLFVLTSICGYSQIEKVTEVLPYYAMPNVGVVHTIRVDVTNNYDKCKILYLRNDKSVTGLEFSRDALTDPIHMIDEYGVFLNVDLYGLALTPFGGWFKKLDSGATFTFYFQSNKIIDTDRLLDLIRFSKSDLCGRTRAMEDLDWKADEIVIFLPI